MCRNEKRCPEMDNVKSEFQCVFIQRREESASDFKDEGTF
jgi:hypothetical protein